MARRWTSTKPLARVVYPLLRFTTRRLRKNRKNKKKENKEKEYKKREKPSSVKITLGQNCYLPLEDQLFDDEKAALNVAKQFEVSKYFSPEFIMASLFAKKFDMKRTEEFLKNCLAWRKEKGFMNLPKYSEIDTRLFDANIYLPGTRDKEGRSVKFIRMALRVPNENGCTVENLTKWITWLYYVGVFHEGMDGLRNGSCMVTDFEGYGWKNFDIDFQRQTSSSLLTEKFPVLIRKILVVNPPSIFNAIKRIMSTILKNKFMDRIEIVSLKDIPKYIEHDQLITDYGGNVKYTIPELKKILAEWAERSEERLIAPGKK